MDIRAVYDNLIDIFGKQWDTRKGALCESLAKVGLNNTGIYQSYPMRLMAYPCIGIVPGSSDQTLIGSQNNEKAMARFQIFFYAFDFRKEKSARALLELDATINEIIKQNRTLGGTVDLVKATGTEFGEFARQATTGADIIAMAGVKNIEVSEQR